MYLIRLDDASEYMDVEKWNKLEVLLDKYDIKPIVGIIPINQDAYLLGKYKKNYNFWDKVHIWNSKNGRWLFMDVHMFIHLKAEALTPLITNQNLPDSL